MLNPGVLFGEILLPILDFKSMALKECTVKQLHSEIILFIFLLLRAAPVAYGSSQAGG